MEWVDNTTIKLEVLGIRSRRYNNHNIIISNSKFKSHTEPICKTLNLLKVQNIYQLAIFKFYFKLINDGLPHYFDNFIPTFSVGSAHYNLRNPCRLLPNIKHEFPRQSLRYNLIVTLNEASKCTIDSAKILPINQYTFGIKKSMIDNYNHICEIPNCYICQNIINKLCKFLYYIVLILSN